MLVHKDGNVIEFNRKYGETDLFDDLRFAVAARAKEGERYSLLYVHVRRWDDGQVVVESCDRHRYHATANPGLPALLDDGFYAVVKNTKTMLHLERIEKAVEDAPMWPPVENSILQMVPVNPALTVKFGGDFTRDAIGDIARLEEGLTFNWKFFDDFEGEWDIHYRDKMSPLWLCNCTKMAAIMPWRKARDENKRRGA